MGLIYFIVLLGLIVTIHELGHFLVAKFFKVYCSEFSIGMGPELFSIQGSETKYTVRCLPLGGYVQMAGDVENAIEGACDIDVPYERTLKGISLPKQIAIMLAGIVMNFVLAFVLFFGIYMNDGYTMPVEIPQIGDIVENSPAEKSGFMSGDIILSVQYDDETYYPETFSEMVDNNKAHSEETRIYEILRNNEHINIEVTPEYNEAYDAYMIGISVYQEHVSPNIFEASAISLSIMKESSTLIFNGILDIFKGKNLDQLSGPVGIYTITSEQAALGLTNYIWLIAMFSMNVGIFNAIPLPIMDGGRVVLALIEMVRGKPLDKKIENGLMWIGMIAILALTVFAFGQDILRLFTN